ncbi:hypothetical protein GCM10023187_25050 [Nibrella viscosa]|uniref:Glycosyl transferase family 1 domain-containing protein n=2 Tax=Nibrella viscosa TaxID=1084524 RepID=A0ABP8KFG2_9BACT
MSYFAQHLAMQGNRVVLITKTLRDEGENKPYSVVVEELKQHDWQEPYLLAVAPNKSQLLSFIRKANTPVLLRRIAILYCFLFKQGRLFYDWSEKVESYFPYLKRTFPANISWGTFGNIDTLFLVRNVARQYNIPYILDIKDPWQRFVKVFTYSLAKKFKGAAGITINSMFQVEHSLPWFRGIPYYLLYSGLDANEIKKPQYSGNRAEKSREIFTIMMVGSIYDNCQFKDLLQAIDRWSYDTLRKNNQQLFFIYAGADAERVRVILDKLNIKFNRSIYDFLSYTDLFMLYQTSNVISYIGSPNTFHHKLIEILAFGLPVLAYSYESSESVGLADSCQGKLFVCYNEHEVQEALNEVRALQQPEQEVNTIVLDRFSWSTLSKDLESFFRNLILDKATNK